ncbi:ATP-binding cassette domain-containing protein [Ectothiorhodospiraceae bacterium BW-2]|nr:ATP-binding cassette domain-containing protein [Ectothiorhodospiraceae bacterium BW-2]
MIKSCSFTNFAALPSAIWQFSSGVNVIVGENGLGKSHLLKAIYALLKINEETQLTKNTLEKRYAEKLVAVMRPESLGRLVKRKQGRGRCEIALTMHNSRGNVAIAFASNAKSQVDIVTLPSEELDHPTVFLPKRELITLSPWFVPLYDNYHLEFEETWRDTVSLLGNPALKGSREKIAAALLTPLEEAMGGKVVVDQASGRFYLHITGEGRMEIGLVAEGLRKLAMLARLISTGTLLGQGYLFWDKPETNLNPRLIKSIAEVIVALAHNGVQIFIASHSLFLLREIDMSFVSCLVI